MRCQAIIMINTGSKSFSLNLLFEISDKLNIDIKHFFIYD